LGQEWGKGAGYPFLFFAGNYPHLYRVRLPYDSVPPIAVGAHSCSVVDDDNWGYIVSTITLIEPLLANLPSILTCLDFMTICNESRSFWPEVFTWRAARFYLARPIKAIHGIPGINETTVIAAMNP
jgi:hypothetical protein